MLLKSIKSADDGDKRKKKGSKKEKKGEKKEKKSGKKDKKKKGEKKIKKGNNLFKLVTSTAECSVPLGNLSVEVSRFSDEYPPSSAFADDSQWYAELRKPQMRLTPYSRYCPLTPLPTRSLIIIFMNFPAFFQLSWPSCSCNCKTEG